MRGDILQAISNEKNINSVIVLTHNIDFIFIQTVVLKHLKKIGNPTLTIYADAQCVEESYVNQKLVISGLGKRYRVVPVNMGKAYRRFHPKAVLLSGKEKASLFVGSGNLTFGGWRQNAEIWNSYKSDEDGTAIFHAFKKYLDGLVNWLPDNNNISKPIIEAYDNATALWASNMDEPKGLVGWINNNDSLIEQMKKYVSGECERLIIQSPYFDREGKTIERLNTTLKPKKIEIFAQNRHSELTKEIIDTLASNVSVRATDFIHVNLEKKKQAFMHAKFYAFIYSDRVVVFSGSANCSQAALATDGTHFGNAELMSIREISLDEFETSYTNDIEIDSAEFIPKTREEVEELDDKKSEENPVQLYLAQYEYKHIKVAYKLKSGYQIVACQINGIEYNIRFGDEDILYIEEFDIDPTRLCLLFKEIDGDKLFTSSEIWVDYEEELSTSGKRRSLNDFIQGSTNTFWSHTAFGELLKVFNEHLTHAPKRENSNPLGESKASDAETKRTLFNTSDVFVDSYDFTNVHSDLSKRYSFDINAILKQYLGIKSHTQEDTEVLTQEELEEKLKNDSVDISQGDFEKKEKYELKLNEKKKIKNLIETLVDAFTNKEIIENRSLHVLFDDLKVASIILRLGYDNDWISNDEYFDATYTLWTEFFFSCEVDERKGYLELKLIQEDSRVEDLQSAELSATMLAWLFSIELSNDIKYMRLLLSAILVHAKYRWVFMGADKESINFELNKVLTALNIQDMDEVLQRYGMLWGLVVSNGEALNEILDKLSKVSVSMYKDKLPFREVERGEILWQGKEDLCIVTNKYMRKRKPKSDDRAHTISLNRTQEEKSYIVNFTLPLLDLIKVKELGISQASQEAIQIFSQDYLINKIYF